MEGLRIEVPATRGEMGGIKFYNFLISPFELLKIAFISHRAKTSANDLEAYQRMVKPARLKSIGKYIDDGGQFPTNIVVNFKAPHGVNFHKIETYGQITFGKLVLPGHYGAAWVIDGQHRLYGFGYSTRARTGKAPAVPVLAYENLPATREMRLFADINSEQVKVSRRLLYELFSSLNIESDDPEERLEALCSRVGLRLDERRDSPIFDRVVTSSKKKSHMRCLTLTSLADGVNENKFLGTVTGTRITAGPLCHQSGDDDASCEKAVDVLAGFLQLFAAGAPGHWAAGDAKGGFLCTNNGLRALFRLLSEIIDYVEYHEHVRALDLDSVDVLELVSPLAMPLADFFAAADPAQVQAFRSRQALDGVKQNCLGMMGIINEKIPEFTKSELKDYIATRDKEGTTVAGHLIQQINAALFSDVLQRLKERFGDKGWWWEGIPESTRNKCTEQQNRDKGEKEAHQYLTLADYQSITTVNWELFKHYDFENKGKKGFSWIAKINKLRQTTVHPEKGLLSFDDVSYVRQIHGLVMERLGRLAADSNELDAGARA